MVSSTKRLLFVHNAPTSFVNIDHNLLRQQWSIHEWYQRTYQFNPISLVRAIHQCDLVFCWFASWHSFTPVLLARLLKKPAIVVTGGYDTANLPEADYGSQRGGLRKLIVRSVIHNASHLITNSKAAKQETIQNARADSQKITVIHHGFSPLPMGQLTRGKLVITVSGVWHENLMRKGLLPFVQTAALLPDIKFMLIGKWYDDSIEDLRQEAEINLEFTGFVSTERLIELYQQASVYVQASLHEGFGMSVAEAMSAGCIPIVTQNGALPEVVGDAGIYAGSNQPGDIAAAICQGLSLNSSARQKARERVITQFSLERRQQRLQALISQFLP